MTAPTRTHPLDSLSAAEIEEAVRVLRTEKQLHEGFRFATVDLVEPDKVVVREFAPGDPIQVRVALVVLDSKAHRAHRGVVDVGTGTVLEWTPLEGVQPAIMADEFEEAEQICKTDPDFLTALAKRGITDPELITVDPWSAGYYGAEDEGRRLVNALVWVRSRPGDNQYAHPVDNLLAVVDLDEGRIIRIEDFGVVPVPAADANYTAGSVGTLRDDITDLQIHQPDGPSFTVDGQRIRWQKWDFRYGFTVREGLVLHDVGYTDGGERRSVLHRASMAEMVVPYGDPAPLQYRKNAFDAGEYLLGALANSLELGCDCLGEITYFDGVVNDSSGGARTIRNAVCLHEEDDGILWKHTDWRTGVAEVRRARKLIISFIATVGNYEYGFYWALHQDGRIGLEVKLTGIPTTGALPPGRTTPFGQLLDRSGVYGPIHQHVFCARLDMAVDGVANTVVEVETEAVPAGPENPHGNAFRTVERVLETERVAARLAAPEKHRFWKIINTGRTNAVGDPTGYRLEASHPVTQFSLPDAHITRRAAFASRHLWVTPFAEDERHPAGEYPNQSRGDDGLGVWIERDRPVVDADIVVWHTFGAHHEVRLEDWPLMPVARVGFELQPWGFFDRNPALDVPPSRSGQCHPGS
ncbi:primary-amine oxidase [Pseudonocardia sp. H11422]|uniref:primary-amine oxidase n=1 Tax=Pseudonocardia sp. H11422 TaxID=2835866 RepID=UPI001BDBCBE0|nr:primary-amine oxidase [Pseudonocardia sp. H11422]